MYLNRVLELINNNNIVEIRGDLFKHIREIARLIKNLSSMGSVHILVYGSSKYVDTGKLYYEIEPFINDVDNITVFWEYDIESLIYHTLLLGKVTKGYLLIILPYDPERVSQIENTYLYKMRKTLLEKVRIKGWRTVVLNPVKSFEKKHAVFKTMLADIVLSIKSMKKKRYEKEYTGNELVRHIMGLNRYQIREQF
uniref:Uncharacterized protein n=1 Tax=Staphylothermus marinus TaxID=2280 RepID=A0A7C4D6Y4_STAMA